MVDVRRRLAAIMFTDMVGYTALAQRNESLSLALVEEQRRLVRPILDRHNGREVKTMGDAFLVEFPNALDAVRCAYDIQRAAREFNISEPDDRRIHLRVGVHVGDIVDSNTDISGDAVNVASRIEPLAEDGGVCITRQVFDHVQNKFELQLVSMGVKSLKNVVAPVEVYRMVMPWEGETKQDATRFDRRRVAVLPFANMSPDPNDEFFSDGMTEELITVLSRIEQVEVISRTSAMVYKNAKKPVREVARELDVGTVIEGSVRKSGTKLRVTVQMIDAPKDKHVWADSYDRDMEDVFAIQSDIAKKVSDALQSQMPKVEVEKTERGADMEAYTSYLRAMQLLHEDTTPSLKDSVALFEKAISSDASFARAYAGLSSAWARLALGHEDFGLSVEKAEAAARRALELAPELAEAHAALAIVSSYRDRFDVQLSEARRAVQLNPNLSEGYFSLGLYSITEARLEEGYLYAKRAHELDPLSLAFYLPLVAQLTGRETEALGVIQRWRVIYPRHTQVIQALADFYLIKRDYAKAQEVIGQGLEIDPSDVGLLTCQGVMFANTNRRKEAEEVLGSINRAEVESVRLYGQVIVLTALGRLDDAYVALQRQTETHSWHAMIKSHPYFEALRRDPRFPAFCKKVGITYDSPPDSRSA